MLFRSTQNLAVRTDLTVYGNLTQISGITALGNVTAANLVVTGNFVVTATNTQVTNALSINNFGTDTAFKVVQYEGGGPGHTYNVAEFWDYQTLAMVIDPEGNVAIHSTASPGYALTVVQGASIDALSLGTPLTTTYGGTGVTSASQNYIFSGPEFGAGAPSFRLLTNGDLPSVISLANIVSDNSLTTTNIFGTNLNVTSNSNLSTTNVTTLNAVTTTTLNMPATSTANIASLNIYSNSNIALTNIVTANISTLNAVTTTTLNMPADRKSTRLNSSH